MGRLLLVFLCSGSGPGLRCPSWIFKEIPLVFDGVFR